MGKDDYSNFFTHISSKVYVRGKLHHDSDHVNIVGLGLGDTLHRMFSGCVQMASVSSENMTRVMWQCGDASVQDLQNIKESPAAQEELDIILSGQREWATPMRPSGPVSRYLLARMYGRDDDSFSNQPHAILVGEGANAAHCTAPSFMATEESVGPLRSHLKHLFVERHLDFHESNLRKKAYDKGYQACQQSISDETTLQSQMQDLENAQKFQTSDAQRLRTCLGAKESLLQALTREEAKHKECRQSLDQCLRWNDSTQETLKRERRDHSIATDEAYAKGLQSGLSE